MSAAWAVQALVVAALLSGAAATGDRVTGWLRLPRRWIWMAAMLGSVLLPALSLVAPAALPDLGIIPGRPQATTTVYSGTEWPLTGPMDAALLVANGSPQLEATILPPLLVRWWAVISLVMLGGMAFTYRRCLGLCSSCAVTELEGTEIHLSDRAGPAVVGLLNPAIVLPAWVLALSREERRLIILHEREHLQSRDGWLLFLATLALAAIPWSLPLWWQHRRLRGAIETDCDARVLARGADRPSYGRILIRTASTPQGPFLLPAWGQSTSQLERRIITMTEKQPKHPFLRSLPLAAVAIVVIATACDVAGEAEPGDSLSTEAIAPVVESVAVRASEPADPTRGSLGIDGMSWPEGGGPRPGADGAVPPTRHPIVTVEEGGSAWRGGLRDGDVLLAVNGSDSREMMRHFPDLTPGTRYQVRIRRGESERELTLEVGPAAVAPAAAAGGAGGGAGVAYAVEVLERKPTFSNRRKIESEMERLYPRTLQDAGIGGTVLTAFVIERDGRVDMSSVKVIDSPHRDLSDATVETVRSFRFNPGRFQGENVRVQVQMPITWKAAG